MREPGEPGGEAGRWAPCHREGVIHRRQSYGSGWAVVPILAAQEGTATATGQPPIPANP
jgi:hypothetical protein